MTRSLDIVNTSNGDGEDYEIASTNPSALGGPLGQMRYDEVTGLTVATIKPGQMCAITLYEQDDMKKISLRAVRRMRGTTVDGEGSTPIDEAFMMNGRQVTPFVEVGFR